MQHREQDPRRFRIHRNKRGWPRWYQRWLEAWWIITGSQSLHRAWQDGLTYGVDIEYHRLITNRAYLTEVRPSALTGKTEAQEHADWDALRTSARMKD